MSEKQNIKVVVRLLPPEITEDELMGTFPEAHLEAFTWKSFQGGKRYKGEVKPSRNSRCYLNFETSERAEAFIRDYHGHHFVDGRGESYRAVACLSPYQKVPRQRPHKDTIDGTIEKDKAFEAFVQQLADPKVFVAPEKEVLRPDNPGDTPLLEHMRKAAKEKRRLAEKRASSGTSRKWRSEGYGLDLIPEETTTKRPKWRCSECGTSKKLEEDPDERGVFYCTPCWETWETEAADNPPKAKKKKKEKRSEEFGLAVGAYPEYSEHSEEYSSKKVKKKKKRDGEEEDQEWWASSHTTTTKVKTSKPSSATSKRYSEEVEVKTSKQSSATSKRYSEEDEVKTSKQSSATSKRYSEEDEGRASRRGHDYGRGYEDEGRSSKYSHSYGPGYEEEEDPEARRHRKKKEKAAAEEAAYWASSSSSFSKKDRDAYWEADTDTKHKKSKYKESDAWWESSDRYQESTTSSSGKWQVKTSANEEHWGGEEEKPKRSSKKDKKYSSKDEETVSWVPKSRQ
eukprot:TRINITY_DN6017_c0_g1_i1.p1 TRINITY_DN6017_c0_g1~~TRINITY_DN6017_c0_g1_i1.p1  ORF type:complete len:511 (+),score=134.89 TRINITY_DN6017_c0_g1_i1:153-1685(+)